MSSTVLEAPTTSTEAVVEAPAGPRIHVSDVLTIQPLATPGIGDGEHLNRCPMPTKVGHDQRTVCGAQTWVKVVYPIGEGFFVCGHHYEAHKPALHKGATDVYDMRGAINKAPSTSANAT